MLKKIKCIDLVGLCLGVLTLTNIFFLVFRYMRGECSFGDFHARWQESAYLLRGINPYDVISGKAVIEEIGVIDPDMVTVPWAWIWGSIISPGFLKYEYAKIWGGFFFLFMAVATSYVCYRYIENSFDWKTGDEKRKWCLQAFFIVFSQYCWVWSFMCGNHGALACCFVVIALCIYKKHPYLAGIMMTFGMIKPQAAALFFITFLIIKQYRVIFTTIICELATFLSIWLLIGSGPVQLMQQTAGIGTNLNGVFFGLFNILKYIGVPTTIVLLLDITAGVLYLVFHTLTTRKYIGENDLHIFVGATIASTFWFYKQSHDYVILIIPCMVLLKEIYELREKSYLKSLLELIIFIVIFYVQSFTRKVVCKIIPSIPEFTGKEFFMMLTCIVFIILGIMWCVDIKKRTLANEEV